MDPIQVFSADAALLMMCLLTLVMKSRSPPQSRGMFVPSSQGCIVTVSALEIWARIGAYIQLNLMGLTSE